MVHREKVHMKHANMMTHYASTSYSWSKVSSSFSSQMQEAQLIPSVLPSSEPSSLPSVERSLIPSVLPSREPSSLPTPQPSSTPQPTTGTTGTEDATTMKKRRMRSQLLLHE